MTEWYDGVPKDEPGAIPTVESKIRFGIKGSQTVFFGKKRKIITNN